MWRKVKWIALACTAVILCVIGYYGYSFYQFGNHIQENQQEPFFTPYIPQNTSQTEEAPPKWEGKERVNILLLGADSRGTSKNATPRSDTIMIASVDPVTKKAALFSILRDTYVKIPGHGQDRINSAFALGGPNLTMKTVGDLLGLPIQYYVYTDFQGFMALVDAIGGIELDVEKDMKYHDSEEPQFDINLKKGLQHMDGKTALQYVRFRHDALSDYSRTERQRKFMTAVAQELQTTSSILRLPTILNKIDPYITTNLSITDMIKLGALGFDVKAQGVNGVQIPPSNLLEEDSIGGASVLTVNPAKLQKFVKEQLEGTATDTDDTNTGTETNDSGTTTSPSRSVSATEQTKSSGSTAASSGGSGATKTGSTSSGGKTESSTAGTSSGTSKPPASSSSGKSTSGSSETKTGTSTPPKSGGTTGTSTKDKPTAETSDKTSGSAGAGKTVQDAGSKSGSSTSTGSTGSSTSGSGSTKDVGTGGKGSGSSAGGGTTSGSSASTGSTGSNTAKGGGTVPTDKSGSTGTSGSSAGSTGKSSGSSGSGANATDGASGSTSDGATSASGSGTGTAGKGTSATSIGTGSAATGSSASSSGSASSTTGSTSGSSTAGTKTSGGL